MSPNSKFIYESYHHHKNYLQLSNHIKIHSSIHQGFIQTTSTTQKNQEGSELQKPVRITWQTTSYRQAVHREFCNMCRLTAVHVTPGVTSHLIVFTLLNKILYHDQSKADSRNQLL